MQWSKIKIILIGIPIRIISGETFSGNLRTSLCH